MAKTSTIAALLLCLGVLSQAVTAQNATFWGADAIGKNQVPRPIDIKTKGTLRFTELNGTMIGTVNVQNVVNMTQAHLHVGNASTNGPIAFWVWPMDTSKITTQPLSGSFTFPWSTVASKLVAGSGLANYTQFLTQLRAGNIYFNIHTTNYTGGVVRAQLLPRKKLMKKL